LVRTSKSVNLLSTFAEDEKEMKGNLQNGEVVQSDLYDGLLGYWPGITSPDGIVKDHSLENNHGSYGFDAKWVWYTNPRAMRYDGDHDRTYVGYLGGSTGTDIMIAEYDHNSGDITKKTLTERFSTDDHTNPAVYVRNDGYLVVFWSKHDGDTMYYSVSESPENISEFGDVQTLDQTRVCYPNPVQIGSDEDAPLYLFFRERAGTGDGHMYYRRSGDGGHSWSEQRRMVTAPQGHYSVYFVFAEDGEGIHFFFTDAEGGSTTPKWNVMYCYYTEETFYGTDGAVIGDESNLPLLTSDLEIVYDSGADNHHYAWIWDAAVDDDGHPAVVYATFPSSLAHEYRYARWNGESWDDYFLVNGGAYANCDPAGRYFSGGLAIDDRDPNVVYASINREGGCYLRRLETDNGGRTFAADAVTRDSDNHNVRPVVPKNRSEEVPVLWLSGSYNHLNGCQTVLKGLPTAPEHGHRLEGDREHGVSLGTDLYDSATFGNGLSVSALVSTEDTVQRQHVVDFEGVVQMTIPGGDADSLAFALSDGDRVAEASWDGLQANETYFVEGDWNGTDTMRLFVDGERRDTTSFEGPLDLDAERRGWTIMKGHHFADYGLNGGVSEVRLYNRTVTPDERETLISTVYDTADIEPS
jgi:hypothetical protein